jgi:hypothetical protein
LGLLALCLSVVPASMAMAQTESTPVRPWQFAVTPFLWGSGFDGTVGIAGRQQEVEASVQQLLKSLDFGVMFNIEARNDRWVFAFDFDYTDLSKDATLGAGIGASVPAKLDLGMTIVEGDFGYRINEYLDVLGGVRGFHAPVTLTLQAGPVREASGGFVDPIVGARFRRDLSERIWVNLRGDIGGFGVGSDFSWYAGAVFGIRVSRMISIDVGYRAWSFDYESDGDLRKLDATLAGFAFGATFEF